MKASLAMAVLQLGFYVVMIAMPQAQGEDDTWQKFTNLKGKSIEAKLVGGGDGLVELMRPDGRTFKLQISTLSLQDQARVRNWLDSEKLDSESVDSESKPLFEFSDVKWSERLTPHFRILTKRTNPSPAKPWAEKTWQVCSGFMPDLQADFENRGFRAPGQAMNPNDFSADGVYRHRIYLLGSADDFEAVLQTQIERLRQGPLRSYLSGSVTGYRRVAKETGQFGDPENRFHVYCKDGVSGSRNRQVTENRFGKEPPVGMGGSKELLVHSLSGGLLLNQIRQGTQPLWLQAGLGWWMENHLFQRCTVNYIDFSAHYGVEVGGGGNVIRSEILSPTKPWAKPVQEMYRNGKTPSIEQVVAASVESLTPLLCGYIFALHAFLLSDDEKKQQYGKFVERMRDGEQPNLDTLLPSYSFENSKALQDAWFAFIDSKAFK